MMIYLFASIFWYISVPEFRTTTFLIVQADVASSNLVRRAPEILSP
uniref:Uncharacterized protein n=1 Tax=Anguilla anguilla TaxID=7936 RepID=A0A0E9VUF8_ANGAN